MVSQVGPTTAGTALIMTRYTGAPILIFPMNYLENNEVDTNIFLYHSVYFFFKIQKNQPLLLTNRINPMAIIQLKRKLTGFQSVELYFLSCFCITRTFSVVFLIPTWITLEPYVVRIYNSGFAHEDLLTGANLCSTNALCQCLRGTFVVHPCDWGQQSVETFPNT